MAVSTTFVSANEVNQERQLASSTQQLMVCHPVVVHWMSPLSDLATSQGSEAVGQGPSSRDQFSEGPLTEDDSEQ